MRRRFRKRNNSNRYDDDRNGILLTEFKFYNKAKNIISDDILKSIEKRLANNENKIFWTNSTFAKHNIGFLFISRLITKNEKQIKEYYIDILELKINFTIKQFNSTKEILFNKLFLSFSLTHKQNQIIIESSLRNNILTNNKKKTINSWKELVDILIENKYIDKYQKSYYDEFKDDVFTLFDFELTEYKRNSDQTTYTSYSSTLVYEILEVIEKRINEKNYRISLVCRHNRYEPHYEIFIIPEDSDDYIYTDKGKIYFRPNKKCYYLDDNLREYTNEKIQINLEIYKRMSENIHNILDKDQKVITPNIYRFYVERVMKYGDKSDFTDDEIKIVQQYEKILEKGKLVRFNSVEISQNKINVLGQNFSIEFEKEFLDVIENVGHIKRIINDENIRYNFNEIYEKLLDLSVLEIISINNTGMDEYKNFKKTSFKVNGMNIEIIKDNNNRIKINDIFCRVDDVLHILSKAICHDNIENFNKYIKEISYIGIDWIKMINNGIALQLENPFHNIFLKTGDASFEKLYLRFSLLWDAEKRNTVYLLLNNIKYPIKYKGKFKKYFNFPQRNTSMSILKKELEECIVNLKDETLIEIIENSIKEGKIITERGKELVKNTIKEIEATETEIDIRGNKIMGFTFKGLISGIDYFIDKTNLNVYKKMNGEWNRRCVIDKGNKQRIFEDKLANRLINIYNEPQTIHTLH